MTTKAQTLDALDELAMLKAEHVMLQDVAEAAAEVVKAVEPLLQDGLAAQARLHELDAALRAAGYRLNEDND